MADKKLSKINWKWLILYLLMAFIGWQLYKPKPMPIRPTYSIIEGVMIPERSYMRIFNIEGGGIYIKIDNKYTLVEPCARYYAEYDSYLYYRRSNPNTGFEKVVDFDKTKIPKWECERSQKKENSGD